MYLMNLHQLYNIRNKEQEQGRSKSRTKTRTRTRTRSKEQSLNRSRRGGKEQGVRGYGEEVCGEKKGMRMGKDLGRAFMCEIGLQREKECTFC